MGWDDVRGGEGDIEFKKERECERDCSEVRF
jgi:hypothetical protein